MKVRIEEGCIACGVCEGICDEVFTVDDNCTVNEDKIDGNEDLIRQAAEECPVDVIIIEE
jgi:ferredoxin